MVPHCQTTQPKGGSDIKKQEHPEEPSPQGDSPSIGCKRQHPEEPPPQDNSPSISCKRQRTDKPSLQDSYPRSEPSWQYPPIFWDRLSTIPLVRDAIEELQRRIYTQPSFQSHATFTPTATGGLARFARHGGPDLRDIRGYPQPTRSHQPADTMNSPLHHQGANATNPSTVRTPATTPATTPTRTTKNAYHAGFEQHMTDHQVHSIKFASQGAEITAALNTRRPSLSLSMVSPASFDEFRATHFAAKNELAVLRFVVPYITGRIEKDPLCLANAKFGNLTPLTDGTIKPAQPDLYYGANPTDLDRSIRDELAGHIIPSASEDWPMVPNFFMELKGPAGTGAVLLRQARYDGALGCRAIHSLQNYNQEQPQYDGKSYCFSATYDSGMLNIYAHSISEPTTPQGRPGYHMNLVASWSLLGNIESYCSGISAFRNLRDLAKDYRDRFINEANARRSQAHEPNPSLPQSSGDSVSGVPLQDAHDDQHQQHTDEGDGTSQDPGHPATTPH